MGDNRRVPAADERVIARMRPHGRVLVVPVLVLWACAGLVALLLDRVDWPLWNVAVLTVAGIVVAGTLTLYVQRRFYVARRVRHLSDPSRAEAGLPLGRSTRKRALE